MATTQEKALIQHLVVTDSLRLITQEDISVEMIPSEDLRPLITFAVDYWFQGGMSIAPSAEVMQGAYASVLAEHEIDLAFDPDATIEWTIETIRANWADAQVARWIRDFAPSLSTVPAHEKAQKLSEGIATLMAVATKISSSSEQADMRVGMVRAVERYEQRVEMRQAGIVDGLVFGFPEIDTHTAGIRSGEVCVVASGPKTGKSWMLLWSAYQNWLLGGTPVIYVLENGIPMTLDRLACMVLSIDARRWQRGEATEFEVAQVHEWIASFESDQRNHPFWMLQPEPGKRTMGQLVRRAQSMGDSVFIDQLTFVEDPPGFEKKARHESLGRSLHELKATISGGMSAMLAHQINREGIKAAQKVDHLEMYHMAEAAEVERTADWVFGMWQSRSLRDVNRMRFQSLAARREDLINWEMVWAPWHGRMQVQNTYVIEEAA
jgi:KaiC/GvpD/RAD55 family RecA-like ATPase